MCRNGRGGGTQNGMGADKLYDRKLEIDFEWGRAASPPTERGGQIVWEEEEYYYYLRERTPHPNITWPVDKLEMTHLIHT